jgi:hypothetical protein
MAGSNTSHSRSLCEHLSVAAGGLCEPNDLVIPICVYHVSGAASFLRPMRDIARSAAVFVGACKPRF